MKRIAVFCGSSKGHSDRYMQLARNVGRHIAQRGWGLVYGGGNVGLMGATADAVMTEGGEVVGVIPQNLVDREVAHFKINKLHIVNNMHERKNMMYDLSDAFLVIPGGMGTLDEMFEIVTWAQLKLHSKPIYLLNEFGFYDSLLEFLKHSAQEGFIQKPHLELICVIQKIEELTVD